MGGVKALAVNDDDLLLDRKIQRKEILRAEEGRYISKGTTISMLLTI